MVKNGLKINIISKDIKKLWHVESNKSVDYLLGKAFSKDIYEKVKKYLNEFRQKNIIYSLYHFDVFIFTG